MALDTFSKRLSAINLSSPWRDSTPIPDALFDSGDRLHLLYYSSAQPAGGVVVADVVDWIIRHRRRSRRAR